MTHLHPIIIILFGCLLYNNAVSNKHEPIIEPIAYHNYPVTKIVDGDTVEIEVDFFPIEIGKTIKLRIAGIDTPELHGKCIDEVNKAKKAKKFLSDLIKSGSNVTIELKGRDKYFRLLGDVNVDGKFVSKTLLETGHAVTYEGATKKDWCK
jgi:endonuclease YncB( thermonuclease family)